MSLRLLDLFSGAGGCARGYQLAGFEVTGVDINPQPRYAGDHFVQADALEYLATATGFDAIHASPPCQSESDLRHRTGGSYPDLLGPTLALLADTDLPWVVENVESTRQLPGSLVLCGTEFGLRSGNRWLRRHRRFASNVFLLGAGGCNCSHRSIGGVYGTGGAGPMTRGFKFHPADARTAMGIDWMSRRELSQAIPPAFTRHVGEQIATHIRTTAPTDTRR